MSRKQKWAGIYFWVSVVKFPPLSRTCLVPQNILRQIWGFGYVVHYTIQRMQCWSCSGLYLITCLPQNILQAPHSGQQLQTVIIYCICMQARLCIYHGNLKLAGIIVKLNTNALVAFAIKLQMPPFSYYMLVGAPNHAFSTCIVS